MRVPRRRSLRFVAALERYVAVGQAPICKCVERPFGRAARREWSAARMLDELPDIVIAGNDADAGKHRHALREGLLSRVDQPRAQLLRIFWHFESPWLVV